MSIAVSLIEFIAPPVEKIRKAWVSSKLLGLKPGLSLLDAGCGEQPYLKYCKHLKYSAQDFGGYDGVGDKSGLYEGSWVYGKLDYTGDIWDIDVTDKSFDAILCTEVFEHIPYPIETLKEFSRILKKDGTLILTVPINCLPHQTPYFFYHGLSRQFYEKFGTENNLELQEFITYPTVPQFVFLEAFRHTMERKNLLLKLLILIYLMPMGLFAKFTAPRVFTTETHPASGALMIFKKTK